MVDFATVWNAATQSGDWSMAGPDLLSDQGIDSAVITSLMTDRLASPSDFIPDGTGNRRGTWMDLPVSPSTRYATSDAMGSKLWLRTREKATEATRLQIHTDIREALQWGIDDGVFTSIDIQSGWVALGYLAGVITITRDTPAGQVVNSRYDLSLSPGSVSVAPTGGGAYSPTAPFLPFPDPPTGLIVTGTLATAASLSWTPAATGGAPASYTVEVSLHGAGSFSAAGHVTAPSASLTVTGLTSSTAYDFRVYATNASGSGAASALANGTTAQNAPNAVTGLTASAGSPAYSAVGLTWTASAVDGTHDAPTAYVVNYRTPVGSGAWTVGPSVFVPSATVTGLAHASAYEFQVVASNLGGTAAAAATRTTTTAAPNGTTPSAAPGSPATTAVNLTWAASAVDGSHDAATAYQVNYSTDGATWVPSGGSLAGTATSATVSGLNILTLYYFQVVASNAGGSQAGGPATQTTAAAAPNAATSVGASAGSPTYSVVNISWTAPSADSTHSAATSYAINYRTPSGSGSWTLASGAWVSGTTASVTGLGQSTGYDFQVVATNAGGSTAAAYVSRTTDVAAPNVPTSVAVAPVNDGTTSKLTVSWAAPAPDSAHGAATGYSVQYKVTGAGSWTAGPSGSGMSANLTGLTAGASYDVQVQATNASAGSPGAWSGSVTKSTYSATFAWGVNVPPSTAAHSSSPPLNVNAVSTLPGVDFAWSASNATVPSTVGATVTSYAGSYYQWAAYPTAPATPGTYYLWAFATNGAGAIVSGAITVT